jgi:putative holliday junction resolvase
MDRYLAIDYGTKRVGLALTDPLKMTAQPHTVLANDKQLLPNIEKIIKEKNISRIILGNPITLSGQAALAAQAVVQFADRLRTVVGEVPIILRDERLTTAEAEKALISTGMRRAERKQTIDAIAASLLLQGYLQEQQ